MVAGWLAITVAVLSLLPSFVPGAASVIGLLMSLSALLISLFSVRNSGKRYMRIVVAIIIAGMLLVNDSLRIWARHAVPPAVWAVLLGIACAVIAICILIADRIERTSN